jgi:hypothetical protein
MFASMERGQPPKLLNDIPEVVAPSDNLAAYNTVLRAVPIKVHINITICGA